ncbi:hypothetical protein ACP275_04G063600 [Erythranthe tilingii]
MDTYEATNIVMSRIQSLEPENASRIMGYILIQDQGEKEIIRLAFCPEPVLLSYIKQAQTRLGLLHSNGSNPPTPLSYSVRPNNPFPQVSPRSIVIPNNGGFHMSNPSSPAGAAVFQRSRTACSSRPVVVSSSPSGLHFYGGDDFEVDQLPFLDDDQGLDPVMNDSMGFAYGEDMGGGGGGVHSPHHNSFHRRSCSVNDAAFLEDGGGGGGFGWRPCMYFAKGFCKNGGNCKFLHHGDEPIELGSPSNNGASGFDELLRMKALQQQRFAVMAAAAAGGGGGHHPFAYNKCMDSLNENPRNDYSSLMGFGASSSSARQIYLTFPADSTFKEEDVSNYFGMFGPVQDVRIPYQQKRMFGFVTFVYAETVKAILAKGNPHFVCDSRVLVKPYKEKGKVRDKRQHHHQQSERGEYSACLSPSGENFDLSFGSRMLMSPQEMMLRRKLEQEAELQHAIELQGRRMMNLQLMDLKNNDNLSYHNYPRRFPAGIPFSSSPTQSQFLINQHVTTSSDSINQEHPEEFDIGEKRGDEKSGPERSEPNTNDINANDSDTNERLEHSLPENLFSSPSKPAADNSTTCSNETPLLSNSSPLTIASLKSCYLQLPRFSSGQEAIEM